MSDAQLKSLAERVERLMDERDGIQSDIRDIYAEAKSHGYVPKVLRKAITRKRMDPNKRDEEDAILELYEDALGGVGRAVAAVRAGATWKEAAADHGVPRATLARAVKVSKSRTDTANELTETALDTSGEGAGTTERPDGPGSALATPTHEMGAERSEHATIPTREGERVADSVGAKNAHTESDGLDIPAFLRRDVARKGSHPDERVEGAAQ